jgi:RNA polymerase sigma-70 factor (ECF subfamily)
LRYASDEEYLEALRRRDSEAEEYLASSFSRQVRTTLRKKFHSAEIVEDATQETFLRVLLFFQSGKTLRAASSLPSFVKAVSIYVSLEMLRERGQGAPTTEELPERIDNLRDPESMAVFGERREIVRRALRQVDGNDAHLLRRVFFEEADKDQICQELKISRQYLGVMVHRAKLRFKGAVQALDQQRLHPAEQASHA